LDVENSAENQSIYISLHENKVTFILKIKKLSKQNGVFLDKKAIFAEIIRI
jgi:hypothetical protein